MRNAKHAGLLVAILTCLSLGPAFLVGGILAKRSLQPFPDGIQTTGNVTMVTETERPSTQDGKTRTRIEYTPEIRFVTEESKVVLMNDTDSCGEPEVGDEVPISYRPDDPAGARVLSEACKRDALIFIVLGIVFSVLAYPSIVVLLVWYKLSHGSTPQAQDLT